MPARLSGRCSTRLGTYLGTLALNGPLGGNFGFFAETYTTWQRDTKLLPGATAGLYWRPLPTYASI